MTEAYYTLMAKIVDNDMFQRLQERFRKVDLEAVWYSIKLEYLQIGGGKGLRVS